LRKYLVILFVLLLSCSLMAQVRTGNIYGKVVDGDGNPLPGVTVTLTGERTAPMTSVTSSEGVFRFVSLPVASDYTVKAELEGFRTEIRENVIIVVGANVELNITMEMGGIEEEVTVTATTPVVDTKKTAVGLNATQEILQSLPTSRDPWSIIQMAPSVIGDRENIGGNESGQQASYVARGAPNYDDNVWAMDGVVITDPAAIGASPSYYDFDAFEEMNVTVGGSDITVQTGGVALNMVTRRGGNRITLGGRFYVTDEKFQADTYSDELAAEGLPGINRIVAIRDYGFNIGAPLIRDRAWIWGSYGVQDLKNVSIYGSPDDTMLINYAAKLNLQIIPENRFEAFMHIGGKNKWGRSSTNANPQGLYQGGRYHFGSPIIKFQDEHMFGDNFFVSLKYAWSNAGFNLTPMNNRDFTKIGMWNVTNQIYEGSGASRYWVSRPVTQYNFLGQYFNDNLFGASHEIKFGVEYADRNAYTESVWPGNAMIRKNYNSPTVDFDGDGTQDVPTDPNFKRFEFWRGYYRDGGVKALAAYLSDTISFGRFNLILGLRYDQQAPSINPVTIAAAELDHPSWQDNVDSQTGQLLDGLMPGVDIDAIEGTSKDGSKYYWKVFSPRVAMTYDVTGDGKTIAKFNFSIYGSFMGIGETSRYMPGGSSGWMDFWWMDNGDGMVNFQELYWHYISAGATYTPYRVFDNSGNFIGNWNDAAGSFWGSFDPDNPTALSDPYTVIDKDAQCERTTEAMLTLEREILTDFQLALSATYRRFDNYRWTLNWWPDQNLVENQDMYVSAGTPPASVPEMGSTGEASKHEWYYQNEQRTTYTPYRWIQPRPDFYYDYWGLDLVFNKRLSNKWMLNGNITYQKQAQHFGDKGYMNPTDLWAYDGQAYSAYIGSASGKINQYTYTRWMFKLGGLYQLPYDFNLSATVIAREGWVIDESFGFVNYTLPNPRDRSDTLAMNVFGTNRLPSYLNLTLRLEKVLRVGDNGRIYLMADLFNALNSDVAISRYQKYHGAYYYYGEGSPQNYFRPDPDDYNLYQILNPRVVRFGVRFTF